MSVHSALSCALVTTVRKITVAAGVFAPGHIGALTPFVPFELVDAVLLEAGGGQRRLRELPSRVGVYFLLAMCLFPEIGYGLVWGKLVGGLSGLPVARPSTKALRDLRRRIGVAPVKALFDVLSGPLAPPSVRGVSFCGYRTVSFDGCTSQRTPDTGRNRAWLGKRRGDGYPMLELMTLVETGTRALLGAVFGPSAVGETDYAAQLLHLLDKTMLVLWDRGFDGNAFLCAVDATGAKMLGRLRSSRRPPVLARLADGSYLSRLGGCAVRIIEASITVTCQDGTVYTGVYRLATTLSDHRRYPAGALIALYHGRWEHESAYYALRHTIMDGRVLRSGDPVGVAQELWALLTVYQVLRAAMLDAAQFTHADPDRASFTIAYQAGRDLLIRAQDIAGDPCDAVGEIGRLLIAGLMPARRFRVSARKVKSPLSRYAALKPDGRPTTSQNIAALDIAIHEPGHAHDTETETGRPPHPAAERQPASTATPTPHTGRLKLILALLATAPTRAWPGREIAHSLGSTNLNSFCVQLSQWANKGLLHKTGPATYMLA